MQPTKPAIHSASFSQPGEVLNPMRLKVPGAIAVEVYPCARKNGVTLWRARVGANDIPQVSPSISPYVARFQVAALFERQATSWKIDGERDPNETIGTIHIHRDSGLPSMCGSRFHEDSNQVHYGALREGSVSAELNTRPWCAVCRQYIDTEPSVNDRIFHRLSRRYGRIIAYKYASQTDIRVIGYFVHFDGDAFDADDFKRGALSASEFDLALWELVPRG